ncbi:hypothetical protein [Acidiphilium acidophilum]|uniref:hypothetical protein n=1 Tax=Acidiphilium acidophilum TaxID=76588 RepID=UPI002E8E6837|nr:hypothetical protein [Acidiphilium acidophilum]
MEQMCLAIDNLYELRLHLARAMARGARADADMLLQKVASTCAEIIHIHRSSAGEAWDPYG